MAKKTNKTEHVLSLLSGTDAAVEKDEKKETEKKGTGQENDTAVQENPAVNRRGNVHVVLANGGRRRSGCGNCERKAAGGTG